MKDSVRADVERIAALARWGVVTVLFGAPRPRPGRPPPREPTRAAFGLVWHGVPVVLEGGLGGVRAGARLAWLAQRYPVAEYELPREDVPPLGGVIEQIGAAPFSDEPLSRARAAQGRELWGWLGARVRGERVEPSTGRSVALVGQALALIGVPWSTEVWDRGCPARRLAALRALCAFEGYVRRI